MKREMLRHGILLAVVLVLAVFVTACGDVTEVNVNGDGNCVPIFTANNGNIVMECFTGPTTSDIECYSPGGTRLHPSECNLNEGEE